jgi:asparagine synthase (glutamine-hydrolysing)
MQHLDTALDSLDQPTFDGLNSYYMSHAVRAAGFKVALVGSGGDELFGGYTSFRDLPVFARWSALTGWMPRALKRSLGTIAARLLQSGSGGFPPQTRWAKLPAMLESGGDMLALYQLAYALFLPEFQRELLGGALNPALAYGLPARLSAQLRAEIEGRSPLRAISALEERVFLGERLLRDTDATSMSASIEIRLPLVDHVLLEQVDRLPSANRYEPVRKKLALRRAGLRGLDMALFDRPKSGFVLPYDRWLRSSLGKMIDGTMRDAVLVRPTGLDPGAVNRLWQAFLEGRPGLYWSRVWAIYTYVRWCHRNRVLL